MALIVNPSSGGATTFTDGSIPYSDGGVLKENNASLFWDKTNSRINADVKFLPSGIGAVAEPVQTSLRRLVFLEQYGWGASSSAAANTTAFTNALAILPVGGGTLLTSTGTFNHNGLTVSKAGVKLVCAGASAALFNNQGTGPNITVGSQSNDFVLNNVELVGDATSTHGIHVIDSLRFIARDVAVLSWGNNSAGIRLDTVANASNGAHWGTLYNTNINGQSRTGVIGLQITGTVAGANRTRIFGGEIRNCATGLSVSKGAQYSFWGTEFSGNTTGASLPDVNAGAGKFFGVVFESNTTHVNVGSGSYDNVFCACSYSAPNSFGTDNGTRTKIFMSEGLSPGQDYYKNDFLDLYSIVAMKGGVAAFKLARSAPGYGASVGINGNISNTFTITATNGTAFTVSNPTNATDGQQIRIRIRNTSGGALGVATWDTLYKLGAAWVQPANGFSRAIDFEHDGTNWIEAYRSAADVAN